MKKQRSFVSSYNLFFLFLSIIWTPLQNYYLHVDGAGRTLLFLGLLAVILNLRSIGKNKDVFRSSAFICWSLLVLYSIVNSIIKGYQSDYGFFHFARVSYLSPLLFLMIAIIELKQNEENCLKIILVTQILYMLIGVMHISAVQFDRASAEGLGNALPVLAMTSVFVAGLLLCKEKLKGGWVTFSIVTGFALYIVILCATRKALGGIAILLIGVALGKQKQLNIKTFVTISIVTIIMIIGLKWIMNNTLIGQRIEESGERFEYPLSSNPTVNKFLMTLLGDRSYQYYVCKNAVHPYPLTGVGIYNFMSVMNERGRLHSEYLVQSYENGIIGFFLLMFYYLCLLKGLYKKRRKEGENIYLYLFGLLAILFLNLTAWTYDAKTVMLFYAVLIVQIYSTENCFNYSKDEEKS